jgi:cell division protein FtsB
MYALEVHALKRELADVRARANSVEPKDDGLARATPAFFITERQYSLLVEENAHLMQTNAQLEQHVATLKEQLHASIRSQQQRISKADDMRHAALDALYEFCVGLGQRLSSIELAIVQQLQSNDQ